MANPTIKGIFVNSHVNKVKEIKGEDGLSELEKKFGKPIIFGNFEDVPVREEVRLIECAFEILEGRTVAQPELSVEAGRLHFNNFSNTPLGRILFSQFRSSFRMLLMNAPNIAGHVFKGVRFYSEELGPNSIMVTMENNDYPMGHFKGFFGEWMKFSGLDGVVEDKETGPNRYVYIMSWK